jgi:hypothetical protein
MAKLTIVATLLAISSAAAALDARHEQIVSMPMHRYAQDCGTES